MPSNKTKFNQSEAARITGKVRNTIAAHLKSGKLSAEQDADGNLLIDQSELVRVYGDLCNFDRADPANSTAGTPSFEPKQPRQTSSDAQLHMTEQLLDVQMTERNRERERLEAEITRLEELLNRSEERQNKITLLLEDRTRGIGAWETSFESLEARVAEQEETLRKKHKKAQQQAHQYREAYEAEKSKTVWQKLFG